MEELKKSEVEPGKFNIESHVWLQQCTACGDFIIADCIRWVIIQIEL